MNKDEAVSDFKKRINHYESLYEPLHEEHDKEMSFIKIFNQGEKYLVNRVQGKSSHGHPPVKCYFYLSLLTFDLSHSRPCAEPCCVLPHEHSCLAENHLSDKGEKQWDFFFLIHELLDLLFRDLPWQLLRIWSLLKLLSVWNCHEFVGLFFTSSTENLTWTSLDASVETGIWATVVERYY